jgi:hypothetical protein
MFGVTPEMYQRSIAARDTATNAQIAGLTPGQLAGFYAMEAGTGLGRAAGGLLGVEDPELMKIRDVQQMRTQFDVSTPAGLRSFAQALGQKGYTDLALQAAARAADIDKDIATADQKRAEKLPSIANLQIYRDRLVQTLGPNDPRVKEVDAVIKAEGEGKGTKIVLPGEQQDKELRTARGKKFVELEDRAGVANSTLQVVSDFSGLIDKAFTGAASGAKLTAGQLANTLGIPVTGTTESEQLDQLFAALTLGQAKNLKGALSDKDVRFLKEAVGSRGLTAETLKSVVARIAREAEIDKLAYDKASKYYEGGGDIAKLNFAKTQEEATAEVNEKLAKQKRLNELKAKQSRPQ